MSRPKKPSKGEIYTQRVMGDHEYYNSSIYQLRRIVKAYEAGYWAGLKKGKNHK